MKDPVFGRHGFLERWEASFPRPAVLRLPLADHFIQEDAPQEIAEAIAAKFGDAAPGGAS
jgi:haloalkane dehalogenase